MENDGRVLINAAQKEYLCFYFSETLTLFQEAKKTW
jgi:hypothetical protein